VIRGDDHLNNTPRQMNMLAALGAKIPVYAHVPMILGPDGAKLSKRHGAVSVLQYQEEGYLPDALLNYLVRLGWSHGDQEIFTREEMVAAFDIGDVNKAASAFNPSKLEWLNQQHLMRTPPEQVAPHLRAALARIGIDEPDEARLAEIVVMQRERCKTLKEMAANSAFFFRESIERDPKAAQKHLAGDSLALLAEARVTLAALPDWDAGAINASLAALAAARGLGLGRIAQPLRVAVTGGTVSPPIDATLAFLGRDAVLRRIDQATASA
jgi:glutamyl-tRNA synthetase